MSRKLQTWLRSSGIFVFAALAITACAPGEPQEASAPEETSQLAEAEETAAPHPGAELYAARCAACHDNPETSRAPAKADLEAMSPAQIRFSMTSGKMQAQAAGLSAEEISTLVDYLAPGGEEGYQPSAASMCEDRSISFAKTYVEGWGPDLANTRHYGPDRTSIDRSNVGQLEVAWAFGLPGASDVRGYPVITEDTVFMGASSGHVFALDKESGCIKWHNPVGVNVRSSLSLGDVEGTPAIFFQDGSTEIYALDGATGETLWHARAGVMAENMGTASPIQSGDKLIVPLSAIDVAAAGDPAYECCKGHGAVTALDPATGTRIWATHMTPDAEPTTQSDVGTQLYGPAGAPVWTAPTLDPEKNRIYVGTGENTSAPATDTSDAIVAMEMDTGDIVWVYQATEQDLFNMACSAFGKDGPNCPQPKGPDVDFGGSISLTKLADGTEVLVGGQKSGVVHVIRADTGELIWKTRVASGSALGGIHWGLTVADGKVFAPSSDPPFPRPGYEPKPGLTALDLETGEVLWHHRAERGCEIDPAGQGTPWPDCSSRFGFSAAPASTDDLVIIGALDGKVFAFDGDSGEIVWQYATVQAYDTVNGVPAQGGAIDASGPSLAGDMLFVPSGYSTFGQMPGNAFIAFRIAEGD